MEITAPWESCRWFWVALPRLPVGAPLPGRTPSSTLPCSLSRKKIDEMARFQEYSVVGRSLPSEQEPEPKLYRMRIFAPNDVVAKSRFWYYLRQLKKSKKAHGEIVALNVISEKKPLKVKNFAIWLRYNSRSGTHNMVKEYRALSRAEAVESMYQDMAARHRSRFRDVQILRVAEIEKTVDIRRPYMKQLLQKDLKFPLPHRLTKSKAWYAANRPSTWA